MLSVRTATVALLGNPNTGKTTLFNALAGMRQRVGNGRLSQRLGLPVVPIQANKGVGLDDLKRTICKTLGQVAPTCGPVFPGAFTSEVAALENAVGGDVPAYLVRRLLLDVGGYT